MSEVSSLGYLVLETKDPESWAAFAEEVLGMAVERSSTDPTIRLRMDDRWARLLVVAGTEETIAAYGWEVADETALGALAERLRAAGYNAEEASPADARRREVQGLVRCTDPAGSRLEFYHNQRRICEVFHPAPHVSGFVTGALGLGHVVVAVPRVSEVLKFYTDVLGFKVTDQLARRLFFLRCNPRHHSLALADLDGADRVLHIMLEASTLDDVGRVFDACLDRHLGMSTIGVHVNDLVTSFYIKNPSGYEIEYGWNGRLVDDRTWTPTNIDRPSLWGHRVVTEGVEFRPRAFQRIARSEQDDETPEAAGMGAPAE
ncbi:MAG: VOC family protein [Candidatus Dormiibacterota bacterium]